MHIAQAHLLYASVVQGGGLVMGWRIHRVETQKPQVTWRCIVVIHIHLLMRRSEISKLVKETTLAWAMEKISKKAELREIG